MVHTCFYLVHHQAEGVGVKTSYEERLLPRTSLVNPEVNRTGDFFWTPNVAQRIARAAMGTGMLLPA